MISGKVETVLCAIVLAAMAVVMIVAVVMGS